MWRSGKQSHQHDIEGAGHETIEPRSCWPKGKCIGSETSDGQSSELAGSERGLTTERAEGHGKKSQNLIADVFGKAIDQIDMLL
jgi:hypothetical protein